MKINTLHCSLLYVEAELDTPVGPVGIAHRFLNHPSVDQFNAVVWLAITKAAGGPLEAFRRLDVPFRTMGRSWPVGRPIPSAMGLYSTVAILKERHPDKYAEFYTVPRGCRVGREVHAIAEVMHATYHRRGEGLPWPKVARLDTNEHYILEASFTFDNRPHVVRLRTDVAPDSHTISSVVYASVEDELRMLSPADQIPAALVAFPKATIHRHQRRHHPTVMTVGGYLCIELDTPEGPVVLDTHKDDVATELQDVVWLIQSEYWAS